MARSKRPKNRRKTDETAERRARRDKMVLAAWRAGYTLPEIARMVHVDGLPDLKTRGAVHKIIDKHLEHYLQEPTEKARRAMLSRLEVVAQKLYPIAIEEIRIVPAETIHVKATKDVPAHEETVPAHQEAVSLEQQHAAQDRFLRVMSDIRRLTGLDKPVRTELTGKDGAPLGGIGLAEVEAVRRRMEANSCGEPTPPTEPEESPVQG